MFKSVWNIQCLYTVPKRYNRDILACVYSLIMYNCLICLWNIFRLYDLSQVYFSTSCFLIYQSLPQWDSKSKLARSNTCTFSLFFLPVSRFLFESGMHDLSVFYVFFHKVITLKVSPRIRSLLLIPFVKLPSFFLSFFLFYLFVYTFVTSSQSVETTNCHCSIRRDLTSNVFSLTFLHFYSSFLQIAKALLLTASNTRKKKRTHYILNNETWWLFDGWQFN